MRSTGEPTRERPRSTASAFTSPCARPGPRNPMEVSYTSSLGHVTAVEWRCLAERAGHVFATREWLLTWWRHYGNGSRPLVGLARLDGALVAIVPLYEWLRHGLHVLRFGGHGPSDRLGPVCAPLSDPEAATAVGEALAAVPLRRFVLLAEHLTGDQSFGQLTGARLLYREASPILHVDGDSWEDFLR